MDEQNLWGKATESGDPFGFPSSASLPDPVASPDSYGGTAIPDPAASPDSYDDWDIPDIEVEVPELEEISIPEPIVTEPSVSVPPISKPAASEPTVSMPSLPDPAAPPQDQPNTASTKQKHMDTGKEKADEDYSGHYSWNGRSYVETGKPSASYTPPGTDMSSYQQYDNSENGAPLYEAQTYVKQLDGMQSGDFYLENKAKSIKLLGIVGLILSIIGCGCTFIGPIICIVGLVRANSIAQSVSNMSETAKSSYNTGKKLCIIGIVLSVLSLAFNFMFILLSALFAE